MTCIRPGFLAPWLPGPPGFLTSLTPGLPLLGGSFGSGIKESGVCQGAAGDENHHESKIGANGKLCDWLFQHTNFNRQL